MYKETQAKIISSFLATSIFLANYSLELKNLYNSIYDKDTSTSYYYVENIRYLYEPKYLLPAILPIVDYDYMEQYCEDSISSTKAFQFVKKAK